MHRDQGSDVFTNHNKNQCIALGVVPVRGGGLLQDPRVVSLQSALQPQQLSQDVWCVILDGLVVHMLL